MDGHRHTIQAYLIEELVLKFLDTHSWIKPEMKDESKMFSVMTKFLIFK